MLNKLNNYKGRLITFEGIDGSGKSTQIKKLKNYIKKKNLKNFIFTKEPDVGTLGKKIKNLLINSNNNTISQEAQILLLVAARYEHFHNLILPNLKKTKTIISDRFQDSTFAYQCTNNETLHKMLTKLNKIIFNNYQPDLTILLNISPYLALKRISARKKNNAFDNKTVSFYKAVSKSYLKLAVDNSRIKVVNAANKPETIFKDIIKIIFKKIY